MNISQIRGLQQSQDQAQKQYAIIFSELLRNTQIEAAAVLDRVLQQRQSYLLGVEKPTVETVAMEEYLKRTENIEFGEYFSSQNEAMGHRMHGDGNVYRPDIPDDRNSGFVAKDNVRERINEVLSGLNISSEWRDISEHLLNAVNEQGFLLEPKEEYRYINKHTGYPIEEIEAVHHHLKHSLEPVGILSEGPREVLWLKVNQDETFAIERDIALDILENHYEDLVALNVSSMSKSGLLKGIANPELMVDAVNRYIENFLPTVEGFQKETITRAQREPDLLVREENGVFKAVSNNKFQPRVKFDRDALDSFKEAIGKAFENNPIYKREVSTLEFVGKLQRDSTRLMEQVATEVLNTQKEFLASEDRMDLNPLLVKKLAEKHDVAPSTVSSIITNKVIQMPDGREFRLKEFLDLGVAHQGQERTQVSKRYIQDKIWNSIYNESEKSPVTDIALHGMFKKEGYVIGTGMIKKLRESLDLPGALERHGIYVSQGREAVFSNTEGHRRYNGMVIE